jgi:photosystem II stability/assembly factor-like uncharacterized protein
LKSFVSAQHGYGIQTDGFVVRTSDGGATWEQVTALDPADSLCADGTAVWATQGRVAYRLIGDEGARGVFAAPLPGDGWVGEIGCAGETAWMLLQAGGAMSKQAYAVFRTLDGGSTWDPVIAQFLHADTYYPFGDIKRTIDAYSGPFAAVDERTAQFVGSCPACDLGKVSLLTTPDGGRSWRRRQVFDGGLPVGASFPDRMHGWVLVSIGAERRTVLIATTDGGASWRPQFETVTD